MLMAASRAPRGVSVNPQARSPRESCGPSWAETGSWMPWKSTQLRPCPASAGEPDVLACRAPPAGDITSAGMAVLPLRGWAWVWSRTRTVPMSARKAVSISVRLRRLRRRRRRADPVNIAGSHEDADDARGQGNQRQAGEYPGDAGGSVGGEVGAVAAADRHHRAAADQAEHPGDHRQPFPPGEQGVHRVRQAWWGGWGRVRHGSG